MTLSIIIPSRTQPQQGAFLRKAVASIRAQTVQGRIPFEILIGLDAGAAPPTDFTPDSDTVFVEGYAKSQAAALNGAFARSTGDHLAILEDDDRWHPNYLEVMLDVAQHAPLVTTNEIAIDEAGKVLYLSDSATPSAWVMTRDVWRTVGAFDDAYRYHMDCDWLGRARACGVSRIHLVEAEADLTPETLDQNRPMVAELMRQGGAFLRIAAHGLKSPLVVRMRHDGAGMSIIATNAEAGARSSQEAAQLMARYGYIPR